MLLQFVFESCVPGVSFVEAAKEVTLLSCRHSIGVAFVRNEAACFFAHPFDRLLRFIPSVAQNLLDPCFFSSESIISGSTAVVRLLSSSWNIYRPSC